MPPVLHRFQHLLLVQVHARVANQPRHGVVEGALVGQLLDRVALRERLGQRDERPLNERCVERRRAVEEPAELVPQVGIR